jgi:hypothetical protein
MKPLNKSFYLVLLICLTISCGKDDDNKTTKTLSGTHWTRTTNNSIHFTFSTDIDFTYVEYGKSYTGTYSFNGSNGSLLLDITLNDPINFKVNGDVLNTEQNDAEDTLYKKQ